MLSTSMGVTMVLSLMVKMYMPRALGPETLGIFYYSESLALIFFNFVHLGIAFYRRNQLMLELDAHLYHLPR